MSDRRKASSGSPYEPVIGFSRAVRVGNQIFVSGTTPIGPDRNTVGIGDPAAQTRRCCEIAAKALAELGADMADVVRTRMFIVRREDWQAIGAAHGEVFGEIRPAATMVVVAGLIDPDWLVEIEFDAVVGEE